MRLEREDAYVPVHIVLETRTDYDRFQKLLELANHHVTEKEVSTEQLINTLQTAFQRLGKP